VAAYPMPVTVAFRPGDGSERVGWVTLCGPDDVAQLPVIAEALEAGDLPGCVCCHRAEPEGSLPICTGCLDALCVPKLPCERDPSTFGSGGW
jgi:hypothetical protein